VVLLILIICQIAVGIAVYVKQDQAPEMMRLGWNEAPNGIRVLIQDTLQCCGLDVYNFTGVPGVPVTAQTSGLAGQPCPDPIKVPNSYLVTCKSILIDKVKSSYVTVGVVAIVFAFLQIVGLLFAMCLIRGIRLARESDATPATEA
jgi:hypothetical protein